MHFIVKYNRKDGKVIDVIGFLDWDLAFQAHQKILMDEEDPNVAVSLIDAPNRIALRSMFGAFFH